MISFRYASPVAYWILVVLWGYILYFYLRRLSSKQYRIPVFVIPLLILSIDAFRTLIESIYFGAWYTSEAGLFPRSVHDVLVRPQYVFIPKVINVAAACLIIGILLRRYIPEEEREIERRRNYTRDLEAEVARRTQELSAAHAQLSRANEQLRELDEMKSNFIDVTSHELRTPLFCLSGRLYILKNAVPPDSTELMSNIDGAIRSAQRLEKLVVNTLKLLEGEEYEKRIDLDTVNLNTVIGHVLFSIDPFIRMRRQKISVTGIGQYPDLQIDAGKIHDVLINLLMNAIKFTPDGGCIEINVAQPADGTIEIHIRDEGVGIDPEDQPHIFEKFFTGMDVLGHSSGEYEFLKKGFGLGLAIVKKFVEMHGGRVGMTSTLRMGSDFYFTLPLRQPAAVPVATDSPAH